MDPIEPAVGDADLTICDLEPIHIPGAIQPHGVLLVLAEPDLRIVQASTSLRAHVGLNASAMLGQKLALLLDGPSHDIVLRSLGRDLAEPHYLPPLLTSTGKRFEALMHRTAAGVILELEPYAGEAALDIARIIRDTMAEVHRAPTLMAVCQAAAERLRALTGFDRVMVYRFRPDDAGAVIAEARRDDLPPYLGLTYPAADIPRQARRLFLLNPLRVRKGNEDAPSRLVPPVSPATGEPLDMSRCVLRATSPIHLEYLRNMGVSASLTLSIVQDGRLWGMFACHHAEPRYVPHAHRLACQALGHLLALQIEAKQQAEDAARELRMHAWILRALHTAAGSASLAEALRRLGGALLEGGGRRWRRHPLGRPDGDLRHNTGSRTSLPRWSHGWAGSVRRTCSRPDPWKVHSPQRRPTPTRLRPAGAAAGGRCRRLGAMVPPRTGPHRVLGGRPAQAGAG